MKFSFINPRPVSRIQGSYETASPPLGILYCATSLAENGIDVSVLDQAGQSLSAAQALQWIKRENPDILGFSVLLQSFREALQLARLAKMENPDVVNVFGNYQATFNAERIIEKYPFVDVIVRGESEHTSLELVKSLETNGSFKDVAGVTFRKNGKALSTTDRPLLRDLDKLPIPDRRMVSARYRLDIFGLKIATKKFTSIISSRGCPFGCRFCGCSSFAQRLWRPRSVENIMNELCLLEGEGYRQFLFVDDNFTVDRKRVTKLCREIRKEKMDIEWFCEARVDNCTYDMLREMVIGGCKLLFFGIESANERVLDYYQKGISPNDTRLAVRNARKALMEIIVGSFIVGAPNETLSEIQRTLKFAQEIDIDVPAVSVLNVFPGTGIWKDLLKKGYIKEALHWETGVYVPEVSPEAVPLPIITSLLYEHFRDFYLRPELLLKEVLRTFTSRFRIETFIRNLPHANQIRETIKREIATSKPR